MLPFHPFLPHPSVDHASLQPIMDPPVRSGTGDSAAFFGNDNALSRRPKVPHGTQRRHLRLILSPKGAVRHSKAALTAYSVAQRCRATLKGGTYGLFCRPKVPAVLKGDTYGLFCRPKVPCGTQRRHLRLILSPKGAVRYSKAALTAYSVAQRCRATLKGDTYGLFCRPKVPHGTQRRHLRGLFVAREHSDKLSREQNAPFRSRDDLGRLFREQNAPSRSRDHLGRPLREQNAPSRSRDHLGRPFREQNAAFHSRDNLGAVVRYGDSTGAPQCRRGETRASATHRETWCLSGR